MCIFIFQECYVIHDEMVFSSTSLHGSRVPTQDSTNLKGELIWMFNALI